MNDWDNDFIINMQMLHSSPLPMKQIKVEKLIILIFLAILGPLGPLEGPFQGPKPLPL